MIVSTTSDITISRLSDSKAGRNWIFAIHPNHACRLPVKSRKSSVIAARNMQAIVLLSFFSMMVVFMWFLYFC